jgi:hypothetical protein
VLIDIPATVVCVPAEPPEDCPPIAIGVDPDIPVDEPIIRPSASLAGSFGAG